MDFRRIVIERLEAVGKTQRVQNDSVSIGAGVGLQNIHAPRRDRPDHFRKKKGTILGDQNKLIVLVPLGDADFRHGMSEPPVHPVMSGNFRGRMGQQIPAGKTIEEIPEPVRFHRIFARWNQALELLGIFAREIHALVVHRTIEIIFRGGVKLPQHLRLPGCQRFRIHGFDVRVGEQRQHLEMLDGPDGLRKIVHRFRIENVAPQQRGGHAQMVGDQEGHRLAAEGIEVQPLEHALHRFQAAVHVALVGHALADVVKQQR